MSHWSSPPINPLDRKPPGQQHRQLQFGAQQVQHLLHLLSPIDCQPPEDGPSHKHGSRPSAFSTSVPLHMLERLIGSPFLMCDGSVRLINYTLSGTAVLGAALYWNNTLPVNLDQ